MSESFKNRRCFNHAEREAVARCPECRREFCRECITEHKGRMLCTNCLGRMLSEKKAKHRFLQRAALFILMLLGFLVTYAFFYQTASWLAAVPDSTRLFDNLSLD